MSRRSPRAAWPGEPGRRPVADAAQWVAIGPAVAAIASAPSAAASWSGRLVEHEEQVAESDPLHPGQPAVTLQMDAINPTEPEIRRAHRAKVAQQAPVVRCLGPRQEQLAVAPQTRRIAPPGLVAQVADEKGVQHTGEHL